MFSQKTHVTLNVSLYQQSLHLIKRYIQLTKLATKLKGRDALLCEVFKLYGVE